MYKKNQQVHYCRTLTKGGTYFPLLLNIPHPRSICTRVVERIASEVIYYSSRKITIVTKQYDGGQTRFFNISIYVKTEELVYPFILFFFFSITELLIFSAYNYYSLQLKYTTFFFIILLLALHTTAILFCVFSSTY